MKELYSLTYSQKNIWYTEKTHPDTGVANIPGTFRMKGKIDYKILEKAINFCIRDNEGMRLELTEEDGEPHQFVSEYTPFNVDFVDFSDKTSEDLFQFERDQAKSPFDIIEKPLYKFIMIKIGENEGGYFIMLHHTIGDAWSITLVINYIVRKYNELLKNVDSSASSYSYVDYVKEQKEYEESAKFEKDRQYWLSKFDEAPEVTVLKPKTSNDMTINAKRRTFVLPQKLTDKLYEYSKQNNISIFSMYMTALSVYLNRITGKEKLNLGTMILNRNGNKQKNTMGMFVQTVPVVLNINNEDNFLSYSKKVITEMIGLMRHQAYPFTKLQEEVRSKYKIDDVLYDIIISYQNAKFLDKSPEVDYKTRWHFCGYQTNSLTIHINDRDNDKKLIIDYDYQTDSYYDKEIRFVHEHIERLLWHAIDNPSKELSKLDMVSEEEKNKILFHFNNTETEFENEKTIHKLIEETVERLPYKTAIVFGDRKITYEELNEKANCVAKVLRSKGVKPNNMVGIMANRSIEMMIGLLGILKSGAAYLPIDPEYPAERIEYMLSDSKAKVVITDVKHKDDDILKNVEKLYLQEAFNEENVENPENVNNSDDLAYVIYTSGSTGNPKGVMLRHKSVNNFIKGTCDNIDFNENKVIVSVTTVCFDIFVLESWLSLQKGLTIVLATEEEQNRPKLFNDICLKNNVNMLQTTPSRTALLTANKRFLKYVKGITDFMVGGEPFPDTLLKKLRKISDAKIYNMYGPTETTVWSSIKDLTDEETINIGRPMANTQFYILDKKLNLCPIGMTGELYIGGVGLAKGYLGQEELTNKKFIKNPYKEDDLIYNTGDLAYWMSNGEMKHMGRSDFQVKIRGYRIELGDVQKNLIKIDGVKDAIIKAVDNSYLVAYLIGDETVTVTKIKAELSRELPKYMIPAYFVKIDRLPYTPNGKVDVNKLSDINKVEIMREEFVAAETETEKKLAKIWSKLLNLKKISTKDDFFDIGGDSLGAINLSNSISEEFDVTLSVKEIYDNPDIERMARHLEESICYDGDDRYSKVVLLNKKNSQNNLFVIHAGNGSVAPYANIITELQGNINCIGVEFPEVGKGTYYPMDVKMEEVVTEYVQRIQEVQEHGPYKFIGWCVGCSVILEIVKQLQEKNEQVSEIYLIAGLAPSLTKAPKFDCETEKKIVSLFKLPDSIIKKVDSADSPKDVWKIIIDNIEKIEYLNAKKVLENLMLPIELSRATQNYEHAPLGDIIRNFNMIRTMINMSSEYLPNYSTNIKCYYFNPIQDIVLGDQALNKIIWKNFFADIDFIDLTGDHFSLFEKRTCEGLVRILNEKLI